MEKVQAARQMYAYPSNSQTDRLIPSRYVPGSEMEWSMWTTIAGWDFAESFSQNAAFQTDLPLNWSVADYDFETMPYETGFMEDIYSVGNADLSIFRGRGGKIIHYQGWADGNVAPEWNLHYYKKVVSLSNLTDVQDFYRFFMYPGMAHIDVGDNYTTAWRCDYYEYLEKWYFDDEAPETLLTTRWNLTTDAAIDYRPQFPWPLTSRWMGIGKPTADEADIAKWVGVETS
ncbi:hypothetical protein DOTSEDRAFT_72940 [Dothistroma septosporum NZE10]|uniref:Carboxylic ester hydrolase n=1 Tax=Dothistroma septosporum (strain NZE10 / CBS 128990) TaxID=675120 RepID=N1PHZ1_DOTSN|nr:hypothetical protein DOTSEDRAFT_72940 [Dothistroma septosporum NZE10]